MCQIACISCPFKIYRAIAKLVAVDVIDHIASFRFYTKGFSYKSMNCTLVGYTAYSKGRGFIS